MYSTVQKIFFAALFFSGGLLCVHPVFSIAGDVQLDVSTGGQIIGSALITNKFTDAANADYFLDPAAATTSLTVAGNVGIGTTAPGWPLHLGSTFTNIGSLVLGANDFTNLAIAGTHAATAGMGIGQITQVAISSGTQAALAGNVIFDSSGGTVTKQAGILMRSLTHATGNSYLVLGTDAIPTTNYGIYSATTNDSYFAGNVGIGTAAPSAKLDVTGGTVLMTGSSSNDNYINTPKRAFWQTTSGDVTTTTATTSLTAVFGGSSRWRQGMIKVYAARINQSGGSPGAIEATYTYRTLSTYNVLNIDQISSTSYGSAPTLSLTSSTNLKMLVSASITDGAVPGSVPAHEITLYVEVMAPVSISFE